MKKRIYNSEARDAQAIQTKTSILEAAKKLFQKEGFDRVTIQKLAEASEVSMPTIYALFKSKRGVLQSLIDSALPSRRFFALVNESMQEQSPIKRLKITAKLARQIYDAEKELMNILQEASVVSSEFRELEQEREQRRYERQRDYIQQMMQAKWLAEGLDLQKAHDILWSLTGRDMYRMLVVEKGWESDAYEEWLAQTLIKSLLN